MPINFGSIQTTRGREYRPANIAKIDSALAYLPMQQRASIIGSIIEESGGNPLAKDETGAYQGLLQWGADRYQIQSDDPDVELNNQIQYIKETLNDTTDHKSWTDGGKGSGYKSFRDTYGSFTNPASDLDDVFRAFNFGYVRPQGKQDSFENRLKVVKQVYDRMKGDYPPLSTGHTEQPDATRVARPVLPVHMKGEGGSLDSPRQWDNLSLSEKSDIMREAVANGITSLREIRQAYNEYAEGGIMDEPEGTVAENQESAEAAKYNDGGHLFNGGGYKPSASIMRDIANWEGSSMETNRSFEAEARDFNRVIPRSVMSRLSQEQLDALYSYGYNVGMGNLKKRVLPTLTAYTQGRAGAEDVASSMWASRDKDLLGLRRRRAWERDMFTNQMSGRDLRSYRTSNALLSASIDEGIRKLNEAINAGSAYQDYTLPYPVPAPFNPTVYDDAWTVLGQDEPQQEVAEPVIVEEKRDPLALMQFVEEMTTPQAPSPLADYKPQATGYEGSGQGMYVPSFAPSHASMLDDSWFAEGGHLFDGTGESWMDTGIIRDVPISEISINPETGYLTTPYSDYGVRVLPQVNVTTQAGGYGLKADKDNYYNTSADNYPRFISDQMGNGTNKVMIDFSSHETAPITPSELEALSTYVKSKAKGHFDWDDNELEAFPERVNNNGSVTADNSEACEDYMQYWLTKDADLNHHISDRAYDIPFIPSKAININGNVLSTNQLDSLAKYWGWHNAAPQLSQVHSGYAKTRPLNMNEMIGLAGQETMFGALPLGNIGDFNGYSDREMANSNYLKAFGSIPAEYYVRNFNYNDRHVDTSTPPLLDAFRYYAQGDYNRGDKRHTSMVNAKGESLWKQPSIRQWWDLSGRYWARRGMELGNEK